MLYSQASVAALIEGEMAKQIPRDKLLETVESLLNRHLSSDETAEPSVPLGLKQLNTNSRITNGTYRPD